MSLEFVIYKIDTINRQIIRAVFLQTYSTLTIKGFNRLFYPSVRSSAFIPVSKLEDLDQYQGQLSMLNTSTKAES
jgi:hypothetical protein